jgi:phage FluMu protein Com
MAKAIRCGKCGAKLLLLWVSGKIPWMPCPICDKAEIEASTTKIK